MKKEEKIFTDLIKKDDEDLTLRPQTLSEYIGQEDIKEMLDIYIKAAKREVRQWSYFVLWPARLR